MSKNLNNNSTTKSETATKSDKRVVISEQKMFKLINEQVKENIDNLKDMGVKITNVVKEKAETRALNFVSKRFRTKKVGHVVNFSANDTKRINTLKTTLKDFQKESKTGLTAQVPNDKNPEILEELEVGFYIKKSGRKFDAKTGKQLKKSIKVGIAVPK
tara:strand:- start:3583 stop:4059 length:477 start_codon:yes stop_codon:yes gene_type:complete